MKDNTFIKERENIKKWMKKCLFGPFSESDDEILTVRPSEFYCCGILFGQLEDNDNEAMIDDGFEDEKDDRPSFGVEEDITSLHKTSKTSGTCRYRPPSAAGLSFFVSKDVKIEVVLSAARYRKKGKQKIKWHRHSLPHSGEKENIILKPPENDQQLEYEYSILSDTDSDKGDIEKTTKLHVKWRPYPDSSHDGYILTISVVNTSVPPTPSILEWEETHLFQLCFDCYRRSGDIRPYPGNEIHNMEQEDREFELLYSDKTIFAIGHGTSPDWTFDNCGRVDSIKASFMPSIEVPLMMTKVSEINKDVLKLTRLAEMDNESVKIQKSLSSFTAAYKNWIDGLRKKTGDMTNADRKTAESMLKRLERTEARMNEGIKSLKSPIVARAFSFAHRAMIDYMRVRNIRDPSWRPFQLGFLLQTLPSLIDENNPDRDVVDLLWFQTGGGKTEAYLAIIAFLVTYRRMLFPETGSGTAVIMRYTLRLLTIQQFQRASILISALELLRRKYPELLGQTPVTAGLWVGSVSSPNTFKEAKKILDDAMKSHGAGLEKLVINACPWCGMELRLHKSPADSGFRGDGVDFCFCCTNKDCAFGGSDNPRLPVNVVDEYLYEHPPTLLLATVDKFAMFAWKPETTQFLGSASFRPPDLIIQDELHLIAGELGTITGVYEAAFDTVLKLKDHSPKYIASTATIRNAKAQVQKLYARDVSIFPSPGLNWSDSFFARSDSKKPGRLYMGFYAPNLRRSESFAPLGATLLLSPSLWNCTDKSIRDAWWTLVAYHGSLRGIGMTHNLLGSEVRKYIETYIRELLVNENQIKTNAFSKSFHEFCNSFNVPELNEKIDQFLNWRRLYKENGIAELTSNRNAVEIRNYLDRLGKPYSKDNNQAIAVLLCTNMVSVGLDIPRLGLMVINGQPFTTGEYIQAGSRVGRDKVPGIVIAHYYRNRARDMSHFENFRAYHESFYRFVEPTSLTPFSSPARKRALHAALVIVMRHGAGLLGNDKANEIDIEEDNIKNAAYHLARRCQKASPDQSGKIARHIDELLYEWGERSGNRFSPLRYQGRSKEQLSLLIRHGEKTAKVHTSGWETLLSMRQVDEECGIVLVAPSKPKSGPGE